MKLRYIICIWILISFCSCSNKTSKREKALCLKYEIQGLSVSYETDYAILIFDKDDVIKTNEKFLEKYGNHHYHRQVFLDYLLSTNEDIQLSWDTIYSTVSDTVSKVLAGFLGEGDTIICVRNPNDVRNYYIEAMYWSAYELLEKGKCEIISKIDLKKVNKIKVIYTKEPPNIKYTEFFFENDTLFYGVLLSI